MRIVILSERSEPKDLSSPAARLLLPYRVPYILPSYVYANSFVCHSYENCRGVYPFFPFWHSRNHLPSFSASVPFALRHACGDSSLRRLSTVGSQLLPHLPWFPASAAGACGDSSPFRQSRVTSHESHSLPFLSFQSLTTIKFSNPLVLTTIRNAGGCTYSLPSSSRKTLTTPHLGVHPSHLPWCPASTVGVCGDSSVPIQLSTLNCRSEALRGQEIPARSELLTSATPLESTLVSTS